MLGNHNIKSIKKLIQNHQYKFSKKFIKSKNIVFEQHFIKLRFYNISNIHLSLYILLLYDFRANFFQLNREEIKLNFKIIFISRQASRRYFATYIFSRHFPFNLPLPFTFFSLNHRLSVPTCSSRLNVTRVVREAMKSFPQDFSTTFSTERYANSTERTPVRRFSKGRFTGGNGTREDPEARSCIIHTSSPVTRFGCARSRAFTHLTLHFQLLWKNEHRVLPSTQIVSTFILPRRVI